MYVTGQPHIGTQTAILLDEPGAPAPVQYYLNFIYQSLLDEQRRIVDILVFVVGVTGRVRSRKQADTITVASEPGVGSTFTVSLPDGQ